MCCIIFREAYSSGGAVGLLKGSGENKEVFPNRLGISDEWTALSSKSVKINLFQ